MLRDPERLGVYVHFPYCLQRCRYCDFFSIGMDSVGLGRALPADELEQFVSGVMEELDLRLADSSGFARFTEVNTIYFGGGTASLLPASYLQRLLDGIRQRFALTTDCEITLEGNPENFSAAYLEELHALGVNRVNVGIQTFERQHLDRLGRYFDVDRYRSIVQTLTHSPIERVGVDLMYGFPGQTAAEFASDLERVLFPGMQHLSLYSLTVEPGTAYAADVNSGALRSPEEPLQTELFERLPQTLAKYGLTCYEVSNYARVGAACRHNLRYWIYEPYLALGPGAHGFDGQLRYANPRHVARWRADVAGARTEAHQPHIDIPLNVLRLVWPIGERAIDDLLSEARSHEGGDVAGSGRGSDGAHFFGELVRAGAGDWLTAPEVLGRDTIATRADEERYFVWKMEGLLQLDAHVAALVERIGKLPAFQNAK